MAHSIQWSVANTRRRGDTLKSWRFDSDTRAITIELSATATFMVPAPQATVGLLATTHLKSLAKRERDAQDEALATTVREVTATTLALLEKDLRLELKQHGVPSAASCLSNPDTALRQLIVTRTLRDGAPATGPGEMAADALAAWTSNKAVRATTQLHPVPMVRLAHTNIDVDPDNIPRHEKDLHHTDMDGRLDELRQLLVLTGQALVCPDAAGLWECITDVHTDRASTDTRFAAAASSTLPFGLPPPAAKPVFDTIDRVYNLLRAKCEAEPPLVAVANFTVAVGEDTPVVRMRGGVDTRFYAAGTAAYPFAEALILAAKCVATAHDRGPLTDAECGLYGEEISDMRDRQLETCSLQAMRYQQLCAMPDSADPEARRTLANSIIPNGTDNQIRAACTAYELHRVGILQTARHLVTDFAGWHHTRCLEPRQTAHACLFGPLRKKVLDHYGTLAHTEGPMYTVLAGLRDLAAPVITQEPAVFVLGPGNNAVATPCAVQEMLLVTPNFKVLDAELAERVAYLCTDLAPRQPPGLVIQAVRPWGGTTAEGAAKRLLDVGATPSLLVRAMRELHTCAGVRTGAGKRYRYSIGVNAAYSACDGALRQLLLATCDPTIKAQMLKRT